MPRRAVAGRAGTLLCHSKCSLTVPGRPPALAPDQGPRARTGVQAIWPARQRLLSRLQGCRALPMQR